MNPRPYEALDARLAILEAQVRSLRIDVDAARTGVAPEAAASPAPAAVAAPPEAAAAAPPYVPPRKRSLENLVAGRGLQIAGVLLVLLGTAFFLELAFTKGWIAPPVRIVLGLLAGAALMTAGARGLRGAYRFANEGLVALGAGIVYLSLWASVAVFPELHVGRGAAFAAMLAVTAAICALAASHRSERLAVLSLIGGALTPALLAGGPSDRVVLGSYLLVLTAGLLTIAVRNGFFTIAPLALAADLCYTPAFLPVSGPREQLAGLALALAFTLTFAIAYTMGALRTAARLPAYAALIAIDAIAFAGALAAIFDRERFALGIALLAFAAALIAVARLRMLPRALAVTYGYLGLAAATAALPALLKAFSLDDAFVLEAALLVALGTRGGDRRITWAGLTLFALTALWLIGSALTDAPSTTLLNPLITAFVLWIAGALAARAIVLEAAPAPPWLDAAAVAFNVTALAGCSRLVLDLLGGANRNVAVPSHAQFALSVLWTCYATALFGLGLRSGNATARWQGLALFALTILKVFAVDLASVDAAYRVGSFVVLGGVLVAVSAWYTRATARRSADGDA